MCSDEGEKRMITKTLKEIEWQVKRNSSEREKIIEKFQKDLRDRDFKKGRVRVRNPVEQKILDSFGRR